MSEAGKSPKRKHTAFPVLCGYVEIKCQLDTTEVFITDLIACSTCFGHHYAHHQELKSIIQWLLPVVFRAVVFQVAGLVWTWGLCVRFAGCCSICIPIRNMRSHRCSTSKLINRHRITWYLLCSGTLPLCFIYRSSICNHRRICPMIPFIYWAYYKPKMVKGWMCCYICRSKPNILPTTLSRTSRYTTTILRLPRCLCVMCPVCRMLQHPANRTHIPQLHTRPATWKSQHEIPQAATTV